MRDLNIEYRIIWTDTVAMHMYHSYALVMLFWNELILTRYNFVFQDMTN